MEKRKRRSFTKEYKAEVVRLIETSGKSVGQVAQELDLTVDYQIKEGRWRGLWFRVRGSVFDLEGAASTAYQLRAILSYDIPML